MQFLKSFPHVYEYHLQCVFIFVVSIFFNFFLYYGMVPIIASRRRRLLQFLVVPLLPHLHEFFYFNFQNRTCTETLPHCEVHEFSFPTSSHSPKTDSEQESYAHCILALQSVSTNFRTCNVQCSCHISLYRFSNSLILDALEREFHGASEYQLFLPCTSLSMCKI